ncbi:hypothetical protein F2Q69_00032006 [Brassica cretica]|uniref:Uncharacterized protein n=1 Tax=Brassica cretica TaxID=69181 RepID=A0A8S9S4Q6_BRACR|nr:hypothetical protein F2Q69_00032006 [Brassica cretica]
MKLQRPQFIPPLPSPSIDFSSTIHHHQSVDLLHDRRLRLSLSALSLSVDAIDEESRRFSIEDSDSLSLGALLSMGKNDDVSLGGSPPGRITTSLSRRL